MAYHCVVFGCSNGSYRLSKWKSSSCEKHIGILHQSCGCEPPFQLFPFPTALKENEKRQKWILMVNREGKTKHSKFEPTLNSRVCSDHFKGGKPTPKQPIPTEKLGYDSKRRESLLSPSTTRRAGNKRKALENQPPSSSKLLSSFPVLSSTSNSASTNFFTIRYPPKASVHQTDSSKSSSIPPSLTPDCDKCDEIQKPLQPSESFKLNTPTIIRNMSKNIKSKIVLAIMREKKSVVEMSKNIKKPLYTELLKDDKKCIFYTNIPKLKMFDAIHDIVKPLVRNRFHRKSLIKKSKVKCATPKKCGRQRILNSKDEFLLTMMKLRLGLFFEDLGDRFGVSKSTASKIFQNWIRALSVSLSSIIFLPSDEQKIWNSTPKRFRKFPRLNGIIDCTEVFIETPKGLEFQRATWSEYKHHNTIKYLVSVLPNSSISFVSEPYTGAISDKAIVNSTKFLETLPPHCSLMTDKGFSNIGQECADKNIHLIVPPGKRGTSQMTPEEVKKTSEIAKTRILVEQVIRRIKTFQILAQEIPISLLRHLNDIMIVCSAISNCREPIMK